MSAVFADTCYWVAVADPRDELHDLAKDARKRTKDRAIVTTDEVLSEFLAILGKGGPVFRERAAKTARALLRNPNVRVIPQTRETFLQALARYEARLDKSYSLVDCASMDAMDEGKVRDVLTHDHHFEQEGYTILMKGASPT